MSALAMGLKWCVKCVFVLYDHVDVCITDSKQKKNMTEPFGCSQTGPQSDKEGKCVDIKVGLLRPQCTTVNYLQLVGEMLR